MRYASSSVVKGRTGSSRRVRVQDAGVHPAQAHQAYLINASGTKALASKDFGIMSLPFTSPTSLSKSANQFAAELFQVYLQRHGEKYRNLLLCPYLIYHSLAMMLVGARGNTAKQLSRLLRMPKDMSSSDSLISLPSSSSNGSQTNPSMTDHTMKIVKKTPRDGQRPSSASSYSSYSSNSSLCTTFSSSSIGFNGNKFNNSNNQRLSSSNQRSSSGSRRKSRHDTSNKTSISPGRRCPRYDPTESSLGRFLRRKVNGPEEIRNREFLLLTEQLLHGNHDFVHIASFIYLDKGVKRTEKYKAIMRDYYETKPKKVDFADIDNLVKTVNEDVSRTTEHIYSDILSKQEAQKLEKSMLLVNAVFFRGFWLSNFTDVKKATFVKHPNQFTINMMSKLDYLPVLKDDDLDARVIVMPFEASDLKMLLILPNNRQSDSTYLCKKISASKIDQLIGNLTKAKSKIVRVTMPIFCIDSGKISIQSTLITMGAGDLFDLKKADMSGVCENKQISLNKILHRCFIICDNRGAITSSNFEKAKRRQARLLNGISTDKSSLEEFTTDHPFMYIIFDSVTCTILLMGLYTDPTETLEVIHESQLGNEEAHSILSEGVYKT